MKQTPAEPSRALRGNTASTLTDLLAEVLRAQPRLTFPSPPEPIELGYIEDDVRRVLEIVHMALLRLADQAGPGSEVQTSVDAILRSVGEVVVLRARGELE